jgi:hypothetical protein
MKTCACCPQPVAEDKEFCPECESVFFQEKAPSERPAEADDSPRTSQVIPKELVDLEQLEHSYTVDTGFSHPDAEIIQNFIQRNVIVADLADAWNEVQLQWLERLRTDLGGDYWIITSRHISLLSCLDQNTARHLVRYAEDAQQIIEQQLGEAAYQRQGLRTPLLIFYDFDDYYAYIQHFYPEGTHPGSGGICILGCFVHVAVIHQLFSVPRTVLAHELTHVSLAHLPIPRWLNEGLAQVFETVVEGAPRGLPDGDLALRHRAYWNHNNIQSFWSGKSFGTVGDPGELSYHLSEVLVRLIGEKDARFVDFIRTAEYTDGGQAAALEVLKVDLGIAVASLLGPGEWRPNRKAIKYQLFPVLIEDSKGPRTYSSTDEPPPEPEKNHSFTYSAPAEGTPPAPEQPSYSVSYSSETEKFPPQPPNV